MTLRDELDALLQSGRPVLDVLSESRELLRQACGKRGEWDPLGANHSDGHYAYTSVATALEETGLLAASEALLLEWWDDFGLRQYQEKERVYRAIIGYKLTGLYLRWGDTGAALRWALLTHADDMLGDPSFMGGGARSQLRTIFGVSRSDLEELDQVAMDCLSEVRQIHDNDWSQPAGFPEEVVRRFVLTEGRGAHLLAEAASFREFHLSPPYFRALLELVHSAESFRDKGESLEDFAFALFLLLPGCVPRRNVLDIDLAFESDIVVRNLDRSANLTAELLGRHFLVECKNWRKPIGVSEVGYFLYRMRLTHAQFGIIFSETGVSGKGDERAARALIRRAFHEDGSVCIVVDSSDLTELVEGGRSFWWMILEGIENLRFGGSRGQRDQNDLTCINGIGAKRAEKMARIGISSLEELVDADPARVGDALPRVTSEMVQTWQEEAGSHVMRL